MIDRDTCEFGCYLEHSCVSINFNVQPKEPETENCELNNSTSQEHEKDLIKAANYVYHGTNVRTFYKELTRNMFHITDKIDWKKKTDPKTNKVTKQFCWWVVLSSSFFRMPVVIHLARTMQPVNQVLPVNDIAAYALPDLLATTVITVGNYYFCFPFKDTIKIVWSNQLKLGWNLRESNRLRTWTRRKWVREWVIGKGRGRLLFKHQDLSHFQTRLIDGCRITNSQIH